MASGNKKTSQCQRDEATIALLRKLRGELLSNDITTARLAALNLAWKQEDGLAILTEALFGDYPRTAKKAAAYGLRKMNGRMRKMGTEVLMQGLKHRDRTTKAACIKSLSLMKDTASSSTAKTQVKEQAKTGCKTPIQGTPQKRLIRSDKANA